MVSDNIFEKSFVRPGENLVESPSEETVSDAMGDRSDTHSEAVISPSNENLDPDPFHLSRTTTEEDRLSPTSRPQGRAALKRTYTDTSGLSLQHRLTEALAQPYHSSQQSSAGAPLQHAPERFSDASCERR